MAPALDFQFRFQMTYKIKRYCTFHFSDINRNLLPTLAHDCSEVWPTSMDPPRKLQFIVQNVPMVTL